MSHVLDSLRTVIPDAKALFGRHDHAQGLDAKPLMELEDRKRIVMAQIAALRAVVGHMESAEWQWLTQVFLPAQITALSHERAFDIPIEKADLQNQKLGAQLFLMDLTSRLGNATDTLRSLENDVLKLETAMRNAEQRQKRGSR